MVLPLSKQETCRNCGKVFIKLLRKRSGRSSTNKFRGMHTINCSAKCTKEYDRRKRTRAKTQLVANSKFTSSVINLTNNNPKQIETKIDYDTNFKIWRIEVALKHE